MSDARYHALPESICREIRAMHDGFAITYEVDDANFCIWVTTSVARERIEHGDAGAYIDAWRKSGLWRLLGREAEAPLAPPPAPR